ncbi:MAG: transposase [Oscillospiraceae bacterium]|nr:transposase [Oscillospiraceae bacterium]
MKLSNQNTIRKHNIQVKKRHTIKDQLIINRENGQIIGIYEEKGAVHDLEIFKRSEYHFLKDILLVGDKGYQGLKLYHSNTLTPYKKPKNGKLTKYQKWFNSQIGSYRIHIEHVNSHIKRFKMLKYRYRNKQKKHLLRISLISGIYNCELGF